MRIHVSRLKSLEIIKIKKRSFTEMQVGIRKTLNLS